MSCLRVTHMQPFHPWAKPVDAVALPGLPPALAPCSPTPTPPPPQPLTPIPAQQIHLCASTLHHHGSLPPRAGPRTPTPLGISSLATLSCRSCSVQASVARGSVSMACPSMAWRLRLHERLTLGHGQRGCNGEVGRGPAWLHSAQHRHCQWGQSCKTSQLSL